VFIAFVYYNKAFDSVEHKYVIQALENQGIPKTYIRLLAQLYDECNAKIRIELVGKNFELGGGVKQGEPLSPKLFTSLLENQFRRLKWENMYGVIIDGVKLTHLRFADDIILTAKSASNLKHMLMELDEVSKEAGLSMNPGKTKLMTNGSTTPISLNDSNWNTYLDQNLSFHKGSEKEIKRRIGLAWKRFWSLKFIL
jgi:hypothetical protein